MAAYFAQHYFDWPAVELACYGLGKLALSGTTCGFYRRAWAFLDGLISAALLPLAGRARFVAISLAACRRLLVMGSAAWARRRRRPTQHLIVMQPNIAQRDKWQPEQRQAHIEKTFRLTRMAVAQALGVDLVIWPETALPALIDEGPGFGERLRALYPADIGRRPYLLTDDAIRREVSVSRTAFFNSALLWSGEGNLLARSGWRPPGSIWRIFADARLAGHSGLSNGGTAAWRLWCRASTCAS